MLRGVLLNAEPVLGDILDGSFIVVEREIRQEYSPVLTEMATWVSCIVMDCRCSGASVINWAVVRRLDGHVFPK